MRWNDGLKIVNLKSVAHRNRGCGEAKSSGRSPIGVSRGRRTHEKSPLKKMNVFHVFRFSVVAPMVLTGIGVAYAIVAESTLPGNWQDILTWNGDGGIFQNDPSTTPLLHWVVIGFIALVAVITLLNQILLFFYWKPSRIIYLASCVGFYPMMLLSGLIILTPLESMLYELSAFISGITLALAFYSPVAERFK